MGYFLRLVKFKNGDDEYYAVKRIYYDATGEPIRIENPDGYEGVPLVDKIVNAESYGFEDNNIQT